MRERLYRFCSPVIVLAATITAPACRTAHIPDAETIVQGMAPPSVHIDTTNQPFAVSLDRAPWWRARNDSTRGRGFWEDVTGLDIPAAERDAVNIDQRTFALGLRHLMASDPQEAAVVFHILDRTAADTLVRAQSRVGLTMALTWSSDWATIAGLEHNPDSLASSPPSSSTDPLARNAAVERWAHAFASIPPPSITVSDTPSVSPLGRSSLGTPVATVLINGRPHEFWLDTGASMTVVSSDVAVDAGMHLAAADTLAIDVVGGSVDARAVVIDSLKLGGFTARGITAAVVNASTLRLDYGIQNGKQLLVPIEGVIGADLLRHMDIVIDAAAGTISIRKPRRDARAVRNLFWVGFPVVRLIGDNGRPLLFGLDTGAQSTYVTLRLLEKLPRIPVATRRGQLGGLGGEGEQTEWVARDLAVSDGKYAIGFHNAPIGPERRWSFVGLDGMIGSDIALGTRLHLDFENGVFDVRPSSIFPPASPPREP